MLALSKIKKDKIIAMYIKENQQSFYRTAYSYVKDPDISLDIIHNAVIKAIQKSDTLKNEDYLKTWFYRILINECLMYLRKNKKVVYLNEIDEYNQTYDYTDEKIDNLDLYNAIEKLEPNLKTIILLRYFEDMKLDEIAKITNTNLSTVKSRLYKAIKILKISIDDSDI